MLSFETSVLILFSSSKLRIRCSISFLALFVKVKQRISSGFKPFSKREINFKAKRRVLPVPGLAVTRTLPSSSRILSFSSEVFMKSKLSKGFERELKKEVLPAPIPVLFLVLFQLFFCFQVCRLQPYFQNRIFGRYNRYRGTL